MKVILSAGGVFSVVFMTITMGMKVYSQQEPQPPMPRPLQQPALKIYEPSVTPPYQNTNFDLTNDHFSTNTPTHDAIETNLLNSILETKYKLQQSAGFDVMSRQFLLTSLRQLEFRWTEYQEEVREHAEFLRIATTNVHAAIKAQPDAIERSLTWDIRYCQFKADDPNLSLEQRNTFQNIVMDRQAKLTNYLTDRLKRIQKKQSPSNASPDTFRK